MKALILAGGLGTRLKSVVSDVPKPMAIIAGKPFLEHQINLLRSNGIKDIILAVSHMSEQIKSYFGDGRIWYVNITYTDEETPMGTAGAIKKAEQYLDDTFLVLNGDTYSSINLEEMINLHKKSNNPITICLKEEKDCSRYGKVIIEEGKVVSFLEKGEIGGGLINRGIYIINKEVLNYIPSNEKVSLEKDIFPKFASRKAINSYIDNSYFIDIGLPETYKEFKQLILEKISIKKDLTIRDAIAKIRENDLDLVTVVNEEKKLEGVLNNKLITNFFLAGGGVDQKIEEAMIKNPVTASETDSREKIESLLISGINRLPIIDSNGKLIDIEFRTEKIKKDFPIIRGKSPLRISFSGGGTDVPFYFEKYEGYTINVTIDKYCYITLKKRADKEVIILSDLVNDDLNFNINNIIFDGKMDLVKAILKIMGVDFGVELYLHNDISPGRGLGSSASFSTLLIKMLSLLKNENYEDNKIVDIAFKAERELLGIRGGLQDQYSAIAGGFNFMEFTKDKKIIYPLRIKKEILNELNSRLFLCYIGRNHSSSVIHKKQEEEFFANEEDKLKNLQVMKEIAIKIKDCLLSGEIDQIGELLHESWINKKKVNSIISNERIDFLYNLGLKNGATGGKLLGAGGGGYILFYLKPEKRLNLKRALEQWGAEIVDFNFDFNGIDIWTVKR